MATYKGVGFDTTNGRTRTGTNSDIVEFDSQIKGDDGLNVKMMRINSNMQL